MADQTKQPHDPTKCLDRSGTYTERHWHSNMRAAKERQMSITNEVEQVASEVTTEIKDVITDAKKEVITVDSDVVKAVAEADANLYKDAKKFEGVVAGEVEAVSKHLTAEEKLALRELEVVFLKAKNDLEAASKRIEAAQKQFGDMVNQYASKYLNDVTKWAFDLEHFFFKRV